MKNQSILYTLVLLLVSGLGATAAVEYEGYTNPAGDKFPIAVYDNVSINATKNGQSLTEDEQKAYFDDLKTCGFNVAIWQKGNINNMPVMNKWTSYLKQKGMNTILDIPGYTLIRNDVPGDASTPESTLLINWDALQRVMSNHGNNPYVWGFNVADEPNLPNLHTPVYQMTTGQGATLATFNEVNRSKCQKVAYANFAAKAAQSILGDFYTDDPKNPNSEIYVPNFENYLDHMVDVFDLKFLTFDLYPVISNYPGHEPAWIIKPEYYNMMDLYGRYCRDRKIPIWLVMLSVEHSHDGPGVDKDWTYPEITEGLLRMQAMNGLAFGMKGLAYWRYGAQNKMSGNYLYKSALYDINKMETTPAWNAARYVNCDVEQYGKYLLNATYDRGCLAFNESSNESSKDSLHNFHRFPEFSDTFECIKKLKFEEKDDEACVLLTHLTDDDGDYVAVVNQDHLNRHKIRLAFYPENKVKYIKLLYMPANGIGNIGDYGPVDLESLGVNLDLAPGAMALFKYQK